MAQRRSKTSKTSKIPKNTKSFRPPQGDWPDLIYGKNPVTEVFRAGRRKVLELMTNESFEQFKKNPLYKFAQQHGVDVHETPSQELSRLAQGGVHQGFVARVERYPQYGLSEITKAGNEPRLILALDCVQDPQNFGTLCRSALAFGVKEVLVPQDRSAWVTGTVCKASAGAVEHLKLIKVTNLVRSLEELKKSEFWIYGASLDADSVGLSKVDPGHKSVLVMGSEGKGLRRLVSETCDQKVKIEMLGDFDSLNVGQAGTVLLYDFMKKIF